MPASGGATSGSNSSSRRWIRRSGRVRGQRLAPRLDLVPVEDQVPLRLDAGQTRQGVGVHDLLGVDQVGAETVVPPGRARAAKDEEPIVQAGEGDLCPTQVGDPVQELADLVSEPGPGDDRGAGRVAGHVPGTPPEMVLGAVSVLAPVPAFRRRRRAATRANGRSANRTGRRNAGPRSGCGAGCRPSSSIASASCSDPGTSNPSGRTNQRRNRSFRTGRRGHAATPRAGRRARRTSGRRSAHLRSPSSR